MVPRNRAGFFNFWKKFDFLILKFNLPLNQPAEVVCFFKISKIFKKCTPQSCMEVVRCYLVILF